MAARAASPEARFVVAACRDGIASTDLTVARDGVQDWASAVEMIRSHGVAALVLRSAGALGVPLPADTGSRLQEIVTESVAFAMALDVELARVAHDLAAIDCRPLVLKGPAIARTIYPDPALRPYSDIDLLVPRGQAEHAAAALARSGYAERPFQAEVARRRRAPRSGASFHRLFVDGTRRVLVELHGDSLQIGIWPAHEEDRWRRARPLPGVSDALMLGPEDQLLQLAVHLHRHGVSRLIWLKDIDLLARTPLDWDLVVHDARGEGVSGSVWLGLEAAARILGTPRPAAGRRLSPAAPMRVLYGLVWSFDEMGALRAQMRRRGVQFHAAESWRGTIPSLVLMGRRMHRLGAIARGVVRR
jgi:hypothetical protein